MRIMHSHDFLTNFLKYLTLLHGQFCLGVQVSADGLLCCTISDDQSVKIYDVVNYDMMVMMRLPYVAGAVEWVFRHGDAKAKLAVSDRDSTFVYVYDARSGSSDPIISKKVEQSFYGFYLSILKML